MRTANGARLGPTGPSSVGRGHPLLFGFKAAVQFTDWPDGGGFPKGFLRHAYDTLGVRDASKVLHVCSGSVQVGVRLDLREHVLPDVCGDARRIPFRNESFDWIIADPPYSPAYNENLYGDRWSARELMGRVNHAPKRRMHAKYPRPSRIVREFARLLRPGGRAGILHFLVPMSCKPLRMVGTWGVSTGAGYAIRAWTVYEMPAQHGALFP